jgi:hypothetical protein
MRKLIAAAGAAIAILGTALAAAGPASAKVAPRVTSTTVTASTHITGRPDSGGNGNWATDSMTRTLKVTHVSGTSYTATLADSSGTFWTGIGDFVPNQTASPGVKFNQMDAGTFSGSASFSFTASNPPSASLVPGSAKGSGPTDTSDWYKLAFPAGTVFGGTGINDNWGWSYTLTAGCGFPVTHQSWNDFAGNNGGQGPGTPAAGGITNLPLSCFFGF